MIGTPPPRATPPHQSRSVINNSPPCSLAHFSTVGLHPRGPMDCFGGTSSGMSHFSRCASHLIDDQPPLAPAQPRRSCPPAFAGLSAAVEAISKLFEISARATANSAELRLSGLLGAFYKRKSGAFQRTDQDRPGRRCVTKSSQ